MVSKDARRFLTFTDQIHPITKSLGQDTIKSLVRGLPR